MEISPVLDMDSSPNVMTVPDAALDQSPFGIPYKTIDFTLFYNPMRPLAQHQTQGQPVQPKPKSGFDQKKTLKTVFGESIALMNMGIID